MKENRRSFFARFEDGLAPSELLKVQVAYTFAKYHHRHQERKGLDENGNKIRYFEHCRSVAIILIDELKIKDPDLICVALLHDVLEDCPDVSPEMLEFVFGTRVARLVKILTKTVDNKLFYWENLMEHPDAKLIKICDRVHNKRTIGDDANFIKKQVRETYENFTPSFSIGLSKLADRLFGELLEWCLANNNGK